MIQRSCRISDRTILTIFLFIRSLLALIAEVLVLEPLSALVTLLPTTWYSIRKTLQLERRDYEMYAVCPKCHALYDLERVKAKVIKKCTFVRWPRHTQRRKRVKCNTQLLSGATTTPKRTFCLRPVSSYLREYAKITDFTKRCNQWRNRVTREGYLVDIYDGELWKSQLNGYLQNEYHLYGMLNVDWVQVFSHTTYSLGIIYAVILNLPRSERYKEENVMVLGVIPGPTEPKLHLNTYLKPIVDDLQQLNNGIIIQDGSRYGNKFRFRVLGCSSDLPATRKLGGFVSYHATQG